MAWNLGLLGAASFVAPAGAYDLLQTEILTGSQASVTFSSLGDYAGTYQHLQVRLTGRTSRASTVDSIQIRFNGVSTASYANHALRGLNSSLTSYAQPSQNRIQFATVMGANAGANQFGAAYADILDPFSNNKNTTVRVMSGFVEPSELVIYFGSGAYFSTDDIVSIELFSQAGANLVSGSRFSLYGLKGAA